MPAQYEIRSVVRALDVLQALSELGRADLSTLSRSTGLHPTTTFRMLESLGSRDFVRHRRGGYEIGPRAFEVGSRFLDGVSLAQEAQALAQELVARVNETANVGVLDNGEVLYIAIAQADRELGIQWMSGGRHPVYCTALGKVLVANLPWPDAEAIMRRHPPVRLTPATIVDLPALRAELSTVARQGYGVDTEERVPGVVCVAAPIRDQSGGVVAGISVSGPRSRISPQEIPALAQDVIEVASKASRTLGDRGPAADSGR